LSLTEAPSKEDKSDKATKAFCCQAGIFVIAISVCPSFLPKARLFMKKLKFLAQGCGAGILKRSWMPLY
jgi:hypothetical protein